MIGEKAAEMLAVDVGVRRHAFGGALHQQERTVISELHYLEPTELSRRIYACDLSLVEATKTQLARIGTLDGQLKNYAHVMAAAALVQARAAEAEIMCGEIRGPLHGVPIAVKDLCCTQGVPTATGTTIYKASRRGCHCGAQAICGWCHPSGQVH